MLNEEEKELSLQIARDAIALRLGLKHEILPNPDTIIFNESHGLFISLYVNKNLRGCIGYIQPFKPLYDSIIELAQLAAFKDHRFSPVTIDIFDKLIIEISILTPLYEIKDKDEIIIGRDGLFITNPKGLGLLLPQVATNHGLTRNTFLKETCKKAGLKEEDLYDERTKVFRFEADIFRST